NKVNAFALAESGVVRLTLEQQAQELEVRIKKAQAIQSGMEFNESDIQNFIRSAKYLMEHPSKILKSAGNLPQRRVLMSLIFDGVPTYAEILSGTPKLQPLFRLSEDFKVSKIQLVNPASFGWNFLEKMILRWQEVFAIPSVAANS